MSQAISSMESALEAAVDAKVIPGAILAASSADGKEFVCAASCPESPQIPRNDERLINICQASSNTSRPLVYGHWSHKHKWREDKSRTLVY